MCSSSTYYYKKKKMFGYSIFNIINFQPISNNIELKVFFFLLSLSFFLNSQNLTLGGLPSNSD